MTDLNDSDNAYAEALNQKFAEALKASEARNKRHIERSTRPAAALYRGKHRASAVYR